MLNTLSAWARKQVPSLYIRQGPTACIIACVALGVIIPSFSIPIAIWLAIEFLWMCYFHAFLVPQLTGFRPEDSGQPILEAEMHRIIDHVVFLLHQDPELFWKRASGSSSLDGRVPESTAKCFVKSLLFMFDDCECFTEKDQLFIFEKALARIEEASGGFATETGYPNTSKSDSSIPSHIRSWIDDEHLESIVRCTPLLMVLISYIVRILTVCIVTCSGFRREHIDKKSGLECWVFRPRIVGANSDISIGFAAECADCEDVECDQCIGPASGNRMKTNERPLVLIPGAGFGLTSFLPLVLLFRWKLTTPPSLYPNCHCQCRDSHAPFKDGGRARTIILYRLPWVEVCRPWVHLPQWSTIVSGILDGFRIVGLGNAEIDVISHSYGTAVANRLLRELCKQSAQSASSAENKVHIDASKMKYSQSPSFSQEQKAFPRINVLALLDPIVLGGATTGLSGFVINQVGPDLSFAFCGNRAGVSTKEVLDYDPRVHDQCKGGIAVYMSANDMLVDIGLARHVLQTHVVPPHTRAEINQGKTDPIPTTDALLTSDRLQNTHDYYVQFCVDSTLNSFHGRWLVEMWFLGGGILWNSPCACNCLSLLEFKLGLAPELEKNDPNAFDKIKVQSRYNLFFSEKCDKNINIVRKEVNSTTIQSDEKILTPTTA